MQPDGVQLALEPCDVEVQASDPAIVTDHPDNNVALDSVLLVGALIPAIPRLRHEETERNLVLAEDTDRRREQRVVLLEFCIAVRAMMIELVADPADREK